MKLRLARKIWKAIGSERQSAYNGRQLDQAIDRVERTKQSKENHDFFSAMMDNLGVRGRAELLAKGRPQDAFGLLMRTDEEEWKYGPPLEECLAKKGLKLK